MKPRRVAASGAALFTAACALVLVPAGAASAHPLGNFTVNRYDGLVVAPGQLRVAHVEDLAEIPATQAKPDIEKLGLTDWAGQRCATAAKGSKVTVAGRTVPLSVGSAKASTRPGQAGLNTLRVECGLTAALPEVAEGDTVSLGFHSAGIESGPGWREITARGDRMTLAESDVPQKSVSGELTGYPKGLLSSPADTATAALQVSPGGPALVESGEKAAPASSVLPRGADRWTRALDSLVARHDLTIGFAALALVIAIFLGAMHALAPGHGKTLMAATAAARGGKARLRDVMPLAASVTVTHTLGVVALGLLVTAGSAAAPSVIAWLGAASGVLVTGAGLTLTRRALRQRAHERTHLAAHPHPHPHDDHGHPHDQGHSHDHTHEHDHEHPHSHTHAADKAPARELVLAHASHAHTDTALAPAPIAAPAQVHDHGHDHDHSHEHHDPKHKHTHASTTLEHTHGGFTHSHDIAPTLRGTILLGFAGGLVPSPSAVVVLVGAAALGKAWFGFLLVLAYGVGLALTLTGAGFLVVRLGSGANRLLDRRPGLAGGPMLALVRRTAPLASAFLVVALGVGLVLKGAASALG
ncbi:urease accessory protein UreH domain-containing protein [Streptomyces sp. B21-083]|uniref:urease accessory protein UreH domain-containing protein n=1 Tax=Streptomyces sp. B21-083 TaxID=3039410 RepID=UPI002FF09347